jgi:CAAX protease family protein
LSGASGGLLDARPRSVPRAPWGGGLVFGGELASASGWGAASRGLGWPAVEGTRQRRWADGLVYLAMVFPTAGAWVYFVTLEGSALARWVYLLSKALQFSLPLIWVAAAGRKEARPRLRPAGIAAGLASGAALAAFVLAAYAFGFRGSGLAAAAAVRIQGKLADFLVGSPAGYLALAAALAVVHSLLEEYYWRWFVFQRLACRLPARPAVTAASLAFAAHHVIIIAAFVPPDRFWNVAPAATAAIALAGALWCLLLRRSGSLLSPWLSHLLVDAALMAVGYRLAFP